MPKSQVARKAAVAKGKTAAVMKRPAAAPKARVPPRPMRGPSPNRREKGTDISSSTASDDEAEEEESLREDARARMARVRSHLPPKATTKAREGAGSAAAASGREESEGMQPASKNDAMPFLAPPRRGAAPREAKDDGDGAWMRLGAGRKGGRIPYPRLGELVEVECYAADGNLLGTALWRVEDFHGMGSEGIFADAEFCGASFPELEPWITTTMAEGKTVGLHFCRHGISRCRSGESPGTAHIHVDAFRVRVARLVEEPWYTGPKLGAGPVRLAKGLTFTAAAPPGGAALVPFEVQPAAINGEVTEEAAKPVDPLAQKVNDLRDRLFHLRRDRDEASGADAGLPVLEPDRVPAPVTPTGRPATCATAPRGRGGGDDKVEELATLLDQAAAQHGGREERPRRRQEEEGRSSGQTLLEIARGKEAKWAGSRTEERRGRSRSRRRRRREERRRSGDRSSRSSSGSESPFPPTRHSGRDGRVARAAAQRPGKTLRSSLDRIRGFLVGRQGGSPEEARQMAALFTPYLRSVLIPSLAETPSLRNGRELETLAAALDALVEGNLEVVGDLLASRFKAVEAATQEGHWNVAKHYELLGDTRVGTATSLEREAALREQASELRLKALEKG